MRILIVHNLLWAHYKSVVFQALQKLVDERSDMSMQVLQIARNERSRASLEISTAETPPTYTYNCELLFDEYLEDISLRRRTRALLKRAKAYQPDVISLTGYYDPAQLLLLVWAKTKGIRVVMQNESTLADHPRKDWREQLKRWIFSQCDGFFCFGSQAAHYLIQGGVPPTKILVRKNAVDNNTLRSAYERALPQRLSQQQQLGLPPNNFVFVGRLIWQKNLDMLLDAFAEACRQTPQSITWGLILLGDGDLETSLRQQVDALGITEKVTFLPGRPWFRVPDVMALGNALVLASQSETWGLVVNEAMVCGMPVIVSERCGCAKDLVHNGQNGFSFNPDQPAQLTHHLVQFMDGSVDTARMGQVAQQLIAPYAPDAVAHEMLDGYCKIS